MYPTTRDPPAHTGRNLGRPGGRLLEMSYRLATLASAGPWGAGVTLVSGELIAAAHLDLDDVEVALLRAAVGDHAHEAAVWLLATEGNSDPSQR